MRYFLIVGYKKGSFIDHLDPVILGLITSDFFPSSEEQDAREKYKNFNLVHIVEVDKSCHIEL